MGRHPEVEAGGVAVCTEPGQGGDVSTPPLDFLNSIQVLYDDMRSRVATVQDQYDQMVATQVQKLTRELAQERSERLEAAKDHAARVEKLQAEIGVLKSTEDKKIRELTERAFDCERQMAQAVKDKEWITDKLNKQLGELRFNFDRMRNDRDKLEEELLRVQERHDVLETRLRGALAPKPAASSKKKRARKP